MKNDLRVLRARHGLSQADLAAKLGVSRQTVNAIETERYDPSLPLAFKIAEVFEQPIEAVFFPENKGRAH
jgi:putative transcriptional regulator